MGFRIVNFLLMSLLVVSCGGGSSTEQPINPPSNQQVDEQDNQPSSAEVESFPLTNDKHVFLDNFEEKASAVSVVSTSTGNGNQFANAFSVYQQTDIEQITWVGTLDGAPIDTIEEATFTLRIFEAHNGAPKENFIAEQTVTVDAIERDLFISSPMFTFNITQTALFELEVGDYYLSIIGSDSYVFKWAREGSNSTITSDGAIRLTPSASWQNQSFGQNVRIAGSCEATCLTEPLNEASEPGSIVLSGSNVSVSPQAEIRNSAALDPVYYLGVYYSPEEKAIEVNIEEQSSDNVTLVLGDERGIDWTLSGEGLDNISQIFIISGESSTVTLSNNNQVSEAYSGRISFPSESFPVITSLDNMTLIFYTGNINNSLGRHAIYEWPDQDSTSLANANLLNDIAEIESVTGTITSYGVDFGATEISIH